MQIKVGLMAVGVALVGTGAWAGEVPIPISPGSTNGTVVEGRCPTFIWGAVAGARSYELVVYRAEDGSEEENPVWRQELPGSAPGWTPALDACLERGGRYAWSVRAVGPGESSEWSSPSLFEVAAGPSEAEFEAALEIVRQYVAEAGVEDSQDHARFALGEAQTTSPASSGGLQVSGPPAPLAPAAGDSDLMVNGAEVVTTATIAGAVTAIQRECPGAQGVFVDRYSDCGNGTVRDNNTGLFWLKDASCSDLPGTDAGGKGVWDVAEAAAAALADGTCGLTDGSQPGDWRQPTAKEFCSAWAAAALTCPGSAAPDSLLLNPTPSPMINKPNPFVDVQPSDYWSASRPILGNTAWLVDLDSATLGLFDRSFGFYIWPVRFAQ